jgi:hypothetical protein
MISFFAKPPFVMRHLQRVSSIIRGEQIAAYMGNARLNPPGGYEDDICIYVKPHIKGNEDFKFEGRPYLDIQDGWGLIPILQKHPEVPVIAFSERDVEILSELVENKVVLIPHHHLNFERIRRVKDKITRVGVTGSIGAFTHVAETIKQGIAERGLELAEHSIFYPRMAVSRFYQSIDVQLVWRPYRKRLSCPLKIVNASSFGIPTIALDEPSFREMEGAYIGVETAEEWLQKLDELIADKQLYYDISKVCIEKSEKYHIDNISKLYGELDK